MKTIEELESEIFGKYPKRTGLKCPVTGSELLQDKGDEFVRDPDSVYHAESDPTIKFLRHPFSWKVFRQVDRDEKAIRYFRLNDDNSWTELKSIPGSSSLFPIDTPENDPEWIVAVQKGLDNLEKRRRQEEYWKEHPEEDPRYFSRLDATEIVEVRPMAPPSSKLLYFDFTYKTKE